MKTENYDVIVVGAGISGLACAEALLRRGLKVLVLEGRSRIGGRAFTFRNPNTQFPIELGAEFIHGAPKKILQRLDASGQTFYDVTDNHLVRKGKNISSDDNFFDQIEKIMKLVPKNKDQAVSDFIKRLKRKVPSDQADLFTAFVEGFHAADTNHMSTQGLLEAMQANDDSDLNGSEMFRPTNGYDQLIKTFLSTPFKPSKILELNAVVKKISWAKDQARVEVESAISHEKSNYRAKCVVITVPISILRAPEDSLAGIKIEPEPTGFKNIISGINMGHAQRIVFEFNTRFWEDLSDEKISFLHINAENYFPTWWTYSPMRAPFLTAWQGGPKAEEMRDWPEGLRVTTALKTLSKITGRNLKYLTSNLKSTYTHNWSEDPFALGAYSYINTDGFSKSHRLAKPFDSTIFIAGEHTASSSARGTVHGALESGLRAAKQILQLRKFTNQLASERPLVFDL